MDSLYTRLSTQYFIIAGPCVMENEKQVYEIAEYCLKLCNEKKIMYVFKASFDKANRTSAESFRGVGLTKGLKILSEVKKRFNIPVTTDIHESYQAEKVAEVVDILQIPAFLCRQTDLLTAAARTGRVVNIKKAQFLSGNDMFYPVAKVKNSGNHRVLLTERGNMYGYNNLIVDFRNLIDMGELGVPIVMDVTHSTQKPGGLDGKSGGDRRYASAIAAAAAAVGVNGHFFEVHPDPDKALSDGPNMIPLHKFESVLDKVIYHNSFNSENTI